MPKNRKQTFKNHGSNYIHPSLSSSHSQSTAAPETVSVNEQLDQLRAAQASPAAAERLRLLAETSHHRSVPPTLSEILGHSETPPPAPKPGARPRTRMRIPGPAPPPSWVFPQGSENAQYRPSSPYRRTFGDRSKVARRRPEQLCRFPLLIGEPQTDRRSLTHHALLAVVHNWDDVEQGALSSLVELPVHLRLILLSYLATYAPPQGVSIHALQGVISGVSSVKYLDLSGLAGWGFALKDLTTLIKRSKADSSIIRTETKHEDSINESWDADQDPPEQYDYIPTALPDVYSLSSLTKLSLSHPPPNVSWTDLLCLTSTLHNLTHLSLAYWPYPTKTPNMKTATYTTRSGQAISASGSTMYSSLDNDFTEGSHTLRQLSRNTYCLRYLDLEGCNAWFGALLPPAVQTRSRPSNPTTSAVDSWTSPETTKPNGPDWNDAWRNMQCLNLTQATKLDSLPLATDPNKVMFTGKNWPNADQKEEYTLHSDIIYRLAQINARALSSNIDQLSLTNDNDARERPICSLCHGSLGGPPNARDKDCTVCESIWQQDLRQSMVWVDTEIRARRVAKGLIKATSGRAGTVGPVKIDFGWKVM